MNLKMPQQSSSFRPLPNPDQGVFRVLRLKRIKASTGGVTEAPPRPDNLLPRPTPKLCLISRHFTCLPYLILMIPHNNDRLLVVSHLGTVQ